jgi:hypothetical protein
MSWRLLCYSIFLPSVFACNRRLAAVKYFIWTIIIITTTISPLQIGSSFWQKSYSKYVHLSGNCKWNALNCFQVSIRGVFSFMNLWAMLHISKCIPDTLTEIWFDLHLRGIFFKPRRFGYGFSFFCSSQNRATNTIPFTLSEEQLPNVDLLYPVTWRKNQNQYPECCGRKETVENGQKSVNMNVDYFYHHWFADVLRLTKCLMLL